MYNVHTYVILNSVSTYLVFSFGKIIERYLVFIVENILLIAFVLTLF